MNIVRALVGEGCIITAYDPAAMENAQRVLPEGTVAFAENAYGVMDGADALLVLTDWAEFSDWTSVRSRRDLGTLSSLMDATCLIAVQ